MKGYMISNYKYLVGVSYYSPYSKQYPFYASLDDCPDRRVGTIYKIDALGQITRDKDDDRIYYTNMIAVLQALTPRSAEKE